MSSEAPPFKMTTAVIADQSHRNCPITSQKSKIPALIAHRGDEQSFVENTYDAFVSAAHSGADYIETDIRSTQDGVLMVHHDHVTGRVTECDTGVVEITKSSWAFLRQHCSYKNVSGRSKSFMSFQDLLRLTRDTSVGLVLDVKSEIKENQMAAFADELLKLDPLGACQNGKDPGNTFNCFKKIIVYVNDYAAQDKLWRMAHQLETADPRYKILSHMKFLKILGNPRAALNNPSVFLNNNGLAFKLSDANCESLQDMQQQHPDQYLAGWTLETTEDFSQAISLGLDAIVTSRIHDLVEYMKTENLHKK